MTIINNVLNLLILIISQIVWYVNVWISKYRCFQYQVVHGIALISVPVIVVVVLLRKRMSVGTGERRHEIKRTFWRIANLNDQFVHNFLILLALISTTTSHYFISFRSYCSVDFFLNFYLRYFVILFSCFCMFKTLSKFFLNSIVICIMIITQEIMNYVFLEININNSKTFLVESLVFRIIFESILTTFNLLACRSFNHTTNNLSTTSERLKEVQTWLQSQENHGLQLIHSIVPPYLANQLINSHWKKSKEIGMGDGFRDFFISQVDNVSILFADIVGFTKMSSNKTAEALVEILNDLFGRCLF